MSRWIKNSGKGRSPTGSPLQIPHAPSVQQEGAWKRPENNESTDADGCEEVVQYWKCVEEDGGDIISN